MTFKCVQTPKGQKIGAKYFLLILTCNTTLLSGRVETLGQKKKWQDQNKIMFCYIQTLFMYMDISFQ